MKPIQSIGILGGGAWGTALAAAIAANKKTVCIFSRNADVVNAINNRHHNALYLPSIILDTTITASTDFSNTSSCDALLLATPAQHMRAVCKQIQKHAQVESPLIICAKGIEQHSGQLMGDVVREIFTENRIAVLSGPTFAQEVASHLPAAATLAATNIEVAKNLAQQLGSRTFRPYASDDVVGVEVAGAIKNVIAIGCGIVIGKGLGENARAALLTRGLREMTRLAIALGGKAETLMGLSGIGDLVLTCGSPKSRNMSLGIALGRGEKLNAILSARQSVAEGVATSLAAQQLARNHQLDCPIIDAVASVLHKDADISDAMEKLLSRPFTVE